METLQPRLSILKWGKNDAHLILAYNARKRADVAGARAFWQQIQAEQHPVGSSEALGHLERKIERSDS